MGVPDYVGPGPRTKFRPEDEEEKDADKPYCNLGIKGRTWRNRTLSLKMLSNHGLRRGGSKRGRREQEEEEGARGGGGSKRRRREQEEEEEEEVEKEENEEDKE